MIHRPGYDHLQLNVVCPSQFLVSCCLTRAEPPDMLMLTLANGCHYVCGDRLQSIIMAAFPVRNESLIYTRDVHRVINGFISVHGSFYDRSSILTTTFGRILWSESHNNVRRGYGDDIVRAHVTCFPLTY